MASCGLIVVNLLTRAALWYRHVGTSPQTCQAPYGLRVKSSVMVLGTTFKLPSETCAEYDSMPRKST